MKISISEIEAETQDGCKVVINAIELGSREVISGYYVKPDGTKINMGWNAVGINDGSLDSLHIPKEYLGSVLITPIRLAKRLNELIGY